MATLLDIISRASLRIGGDPVSSLDEDTTEAQLWSAIWSPVLHQSLDSEAWNFASVTIELSRLIDTPADPNWQYQFALPADLQTIRFAMNSGGSRLGTGTWAQEGQVILSNHDRVFLKYIRTYAEADVTTLPGYFVDYFVCALGYEASEKLIGVGAVTERLLRDVQLALRTARKHDGASEAGTVLFSPSSWRRARGV